MLTQEQINANKERYLSLISQLTEGNVQGLIDWLNNSDFFTAPASTKYHCSYAGGLCEHSLHVYDNLVFLANSYRPGMFDNNTLIVAALLHDLAKVNFYEPEIKNKKVYNENGSKHDNMGKFDWVAINGWKVREVDQRFLGGEHGFNSMILANQFIPMDYQILLSILHHHVGIGEAKQLTDLSGILNRYPLVSLLHTADFLSTFQTEAGTNVESN